ncbi:MAG: PD-(D/E)XK nuclease family protein [Bdellovibrionales bacterium]|nr:PD-(D/E)XK nuclease family protein [Bdellovibrionales bacterium]
MNVVSVKKFSQKLDRLESFNPKTDTWVVSDLQSKWEIQDVLLKKELVLEEDAVLRASEFWARLLFRVSPDWSLISKELFDQWIWSWMDKNDLVWLKSTDSAGLLHKHLEFFIPLFLEPNSSELMEEWFENNPDSVIRWRHIYEVCRSLWSELCELKMVSPSLVPMVLLYELKSKDLTKPLWTRQVFLDLGPKPMLTEDLLGKHLVDLGVQVESLVTSVDAKEIIFDGELKRLPTQLGEAKEAVSRVRKILDQGVSPSEILILAPDIESFWPSLEFFLSEEGVPCNKAVVQRLIDDSQIQSWISVLRIQLDRFGSKDLESFFFQNKRNLSMSYDEYRRLFENLKSPSEARRWQKWVEPHVDSAGPLDLVEFFSWTVDFWPSSFSTDALDRAWKAMSKDYNPKLKLTLSDWVYYLESKLSKSETQIVEPDRQGVQLLSLSSGEWSPAKHLIFLGLNESDLSSISQLSVSRFECDKLKQDLGFELDLRDLSSEELYLAWILGKPVDSKSFLTSSVTFLGQEVSPSKHWLKAAFAVSEEKVKTVESPGRIRFDEILKNHEGKVADLFEPFAMRKFSLSATSVKSYSSCPFIFFSQKALQLVDQPTLDFDLDPMNKGRWFHGVLEEVVKDFARARENSAWLEELIDSKRRDLNIEIGEDRIWPAMSNEILKMVQNFIGMEVELRSSRPDLKTLGTEVGFQFYFHPKNLSLFNEPKSEEEVLVTGRIDRVDGIGLPGDADRPVSVIDYKLSSGRLKTWRSWVEEGDLQMPLYTVALESGLSDLESEGELDVKSVYYLVPRTKERDKGYFLKDSQAEALCEVPGSRSGSWLKLDDKQSLLTQSLELLGEVAQNVRKGNFEPNPKKMDLCDSCRWRNLCRAPHLI